jgi:hypothetical protein
MTPLLGSVMSGLLALRFNLDDYTNMYASPRAALLFWAAFVVIVAIVVGVTLFMFRRMRPH